MNEIKALRDYLASLPPGDVAAEEVAELERLLSACWNQFAGSEQGGMEATKLLGRVEALEWRPPVLQFSVERHGAMMAGGSSRAEIQQWRVNLDRNDARISSTRSRQKRPMDKRLDVAPLAAGIGELIKTNRADARLSWRGPNHVIVATAEVIPSTNQQTTAGQRKRFSVALENFLSGSGWRRKPITRRLEFERNEDPADQESNP